MKGLLIKTPWIEMILNGEKTWEIIGSNTDTCGKIDRAQNSSGLQIQV